LAALGMQPSHGEPRADVAPSDQLFQFSGAPGEINDLRASVQHPTWLRSQPLRVTAGRPVMLKQQVQRASVAENVNVRAESAVGVPAFGSYFLMDRPWPL
jgi:hypothetical protein